MTETSPPMDLSAKLWLVFMAATALTGVAIVIYRFSADTPAAARRPPPAPTITAVEPAPQPASPVSPDGLLPVDLFPESGFSQPATPEGKAALHKAMVNQQADYLLELRAKYPKTASLATPEQIEEMRKSGRLAQ